MSFTKRCRAMLLAGALTLTVTSSAAAAQAPVPLGTASSTAVLAASTVTNTGGSVLNGDLGLSPGTSITGFPPGIVNGVTRSADAAAAQQQADLGIAYADAASRGPALAVPSDLGGLTVTGGVYRSASALGLTGTLTLDAQGNPDSVFIFQAGSSLVTATGSRVRLINGARPCNVVWQVGSSATLGTGSTFAGDLLAQTSITLNDSVKVSGRALARTGAVTLLNDVVSPSTCAAAGTVTGGGAVGGGTTTTTGSGTALLTTGPTSIGRQVGRFGTTQCVDRSFQAVITGLAIRRVEFSVAGRVVAVGRGPGPHRASIDQGRGIRTVVARVTYTDGTPAATLRLRYRSCAAAVRATPPRPSTRPPGFTG